MNQPTAGLGAGWVVGRVVVGMASVVGVVWLLNLAADAPFSWLVRSVQLSW